MCQMSVASKINNLQYLLGHDSFIKQSNSDNNAEAGGVDLCKFMMLGAL